MCKGVTIVDIIWKGFNGEFIYPIVIKGLDNFIRVCIGVMSFPKGRDQIIVTLRG